MKRRTGYEVLAAGSLAIGGAAATLALAGAALQHLRSAAAGTENLMPVLIECVEAEATLGEICGSLRAQWGEYQPGASR